MNRFTTKAKVWTTIGLLSLVGCYFTWIGNIYIQQIDGSVIKENFNTTSPVPTTNPPQAFKDGAKHLLNIKLSKDHTIVIFDEIGENGTGIVNQINYLSDSISPTVLLLNSPGGSVLVGAQIVSAIEASHTPVYAIVTGMCASMCSLILEYSSKRFMVDRSLLMFHPAAGNLGGMFPQMESRFKMFDSFVKKMDQHVANRVGLSLDKFLLMINNELWMDSEQALDTHFIDGIVRIDMSSLNLSPTAGSETLNKLDINLKD